MVKGICIKLLCCVSEGNYLIWGNIKVNNKLEMQTKKKKKKKKGFKMNANH